MSHRATIRLTAGDGTATTIPVDVLASHIRDECSFVRFYDAAETMQDDRVHPQDWALPALLQAPWQSADPYDRLLRTPNGERTSHWEAIDCLLGTVEPSWSLLDDKAAELYRPMVQTLIVRTMQTPWVKAAVATKLLHKKRPKLIPVVDREVWGFYRPSGLRSSYPSATQVCDVMFGPFLRDLKGNLGAVGELQTALRKCEQLPPLSEVRLLEMTVWLARRRPAAVLKG